MLKERSKLVEYVCKCVYKNLPEKYQNVFYMVVEENYVDCYVYLLDYITYTKPMLLSEITEQVVSDMAKKLLTHIIEKVKEEYRNQTILKLAGVE